jgi:hypothetical protein
MRLRRHLAVGVAFGVAYFPATALAGAFVFAGEGNGVDLVAHPAGYTGIGGNVVVEVCIAPGSPNEAAMVQSVQNIVATVNAGQEVQPNVVTGGGNNIASNQIDFESVALHEVGHCIGLAHPNLGSQAGVSGFDTNTNFTNSTDGADNTFGLNTGVDGVYGSADDIRGDDVNLHWFFIGDNNPFVRGSATVDGTSFSRDLADLPPGDTFPANASIGTGPGYGVVRTEAVMQQGSRFDEEQRELSVSDITTLEFARSGLDRTAGNADDYTVELVYGGIKSGCDVNLAFDDAQTGFAVCQLSGLVFNNDHARITSANSYYNNSAVNWFFNNTSVEANHTLTAALTGTGGGTVTDNYGQITCFDGAASDCSGTYDEGEPVQVTAVADTGSTFTGWSGNCAGTANSDTVILDADRSCTANFAIDTGSVTPNPTSFSVSEPNGSQSVTVTLGSAPSADVSMALSSSDSGECQASTNNLVINSGNTQASFNVSAVADNANDGDQACTILIGNSSSADPAFDGVSVSDLAVTVSDINVALVVSRSGTGTGSVSDNLGQIDCGSDCSGVYEDGELVELTAIASGGSVFSGWSGSCSGNNATVSINVSAGNSCDAEFATLGNITPNPTNLTLNEPDGSDSVTLTLSGTPSADVSIALSSSDSGECQPSTGTLVIASGTTQASFDVQAVADGSIDGNQSCTITTGASSSPDPAFDGINPTDINVTVVDVDQPQQIFSDRFEAL